MFSLPKTKFELLIHPYRLALESRWPSRSFQQGKLTREGWILELRQGGWCGYGECAPLVEAGTESMRTAGKVLQRLTSQLQDSGTTTGWLESIRKEAPAVCCGLETAMLDLDSRKRDITMRRLLDAGATDSFRVNAMTGEACVNGVQQACRQGFKVIKLKLGRRSFQEELRCLEAVAASLPRGTRLRLDANRAWKPSTARRFLEAIADLPIDCLEEPLASPSIAELARLQNDTGLPLAIDESLNHLDRTELFDLAPVKRLVLKPMVLGGLRPTLELARQANQCGMTPIVTSTLESSIGLHATCQLAAVVETLAPGNHHGLATASWFETNLAPPPLIEQGKVRLTDRPGLGITP